MNAVHASKKKAEDARREELQRLRAEVREKDEEIQRLAGGDEMGSGRVTELERQVEELRRQLNTPSAAPVQDESMYDWTMAARDPFNPDEYSAGRDELPGSDPMDADDDDEFGETTMADLQCSTPSRRSDNRTRCVGSGSFPTPPATSPTAMPVETEIRLPMTPSSRISTPRSSSHAAVQVSVTDPEKDAMEREMVSLQLEIIKLTSTVETYQGMATRLQEKLAPYSVNDEDGEAAPGDQTTTMSSSSCTQAETHTQATDIETSLTSLLAALSTRTTSLLSLTSTLSTLGFPGSTAPSILTSISTSLRTARLELEYLSPGESALPLSTLR